MTEVEQLRADVATLTANMASILEAIKPKEAKPEKTDAELIQEAKTELVTGSAIEALQNRRVAKIAKTVKSQELAYEIIESSNIPATEKLRQRQQLRWL